MNENRRVFTVSEEKAEKLIDRLIFCAYCKEPFKECDTVIPGVGIRVGDTDVWEFKKHYWHYGCIEDSEKVA